MNQKLKKKLTPELLSEVLGEDIAEIIEIKDNNIIFRCLGFNKHKIENLDTLTRKMKEYIIKEGYEPDIYYQNGVMEFQLCIDEISLISFDNIPEQEAMLKATLYVAKQIKE